MGLRPAPYVKPFQDALRDANNSRKQSYREIADRFLEHEPVRINGKVILEKSTGCS